MTKTELEKYRQTLLSLGKRLRGQVSDAAGEALRRTGADPSGNLSNVPNHPADLSNDTYEHEVAIGVLENEEQLLEQIVRALDRIDSGTYGRCQECGQDIATERLHAIPYTPYCVECARKVEAAGPTQP
jgi:DnaK suppressor protein